MRFAIALMLMPILPLAVAPAPAMAETAPAATQDAALLRFLDDAFDARIALQPESQTQLGLKTNYDRLDDYTDAARSEEHTSELQSLMRISYAVFCLKKKKHKHTKPLTDTHHQIRIPPQHR